MSEYTPGLNEFRDWLRNTLKDGLYPRSATEVLVREDAFNRLLNKLRAEAWDQGAATVDAVGMTATELNPMHGNPYREATE